MKKIWIVFMFIFLLGCGKTSDEILVDNGQKIIKIKVEIADDDLERQQGLMFRSFLEENGGMLFIFDDEKKHDFWMKNTLIPLDMIFINENKKIVDIKYAQPCEKDPCELYEPLESAKYVLEVNGNFTIENSIKIGDKFILNN